MLTPSRNNGFLNMLEAMRKRTRALSGGPMPSFPSLKISATDITPQGTFAEAQAQFLRPDPAQVDRLVKVCVLMHAVFLLISRNSRLGQGALTSSQSQTGSKRLWSGSGCSGITCHVHTAVKASALRSLPQAGLSEVPPALLRCCPRGALGW